MKKTISLASPQIGDEEITQVEEVLRSGNLVEGRFTQELEREFAEYCGVKYAIAATNGTAALHLALASIGLSPGDEVITTAFTFIASSNSICFVGGIPVFADIEKETYNINPVEIRKFISPKTRAILPVHIFGLPCRMKEIVEIAEEIDLFVIEDSAQAHGGKIDGKSVGSFSDIACFSFYATKNMISGEGGMIVTNNEELAITCKTLKNHGRGPEGGYHHTRVGYNFRIPDFASAIALGQLKKLPKFLEVRERNVSILRKELEDQEGIWFQKTPDGFTHANYVFAPRLRSSQNVQSTIEKLNKAGISSRRIYSVPSYKQPAYNNIQDWIWSEFVTYPDYSALNLPKTESIASTHFEIPIHPGISENDAVYIGETLKSILRGNS